MSADDLDDPRIPEGGTPAWWILDFRASHPLAHSAILRLSLENILDRNYREHGSGINGPGRSLVLAVQKGWGIP